MIKRIERLLLLVRRLSAAPGLDADQLSEDLGVSRRTIFRDLQTLRAAGVELRFDAPQAGYEVDDAQRLLGSGTRAELESLLLMAATSSFPADDQIGIATLTLIEELSGLLDVDGKQRVHAALVAKREGMRSAGFSRSNATRLLDAARGRLPVLLQVGGVLRESRDELHVLPLRLASVDARLVVDAVQLKDHTKLRISINRIALVLPLDSPPVRLSSQLTTWETPDTELL